MRETADIDHALLEATMVHVETNPHLHDQGRWFDSDGRTCFAGRAALLSGAVLPPRYVWGRGMPWTLNADGTYSDLLPGGSSNPTSVSVFTWSQRKLGLTMDQARVLFSPLRNVESLRALVDLLKDDPSVNEAEMIAVAYAYEAVPEGAYTPGWD